MASPGRTHSLVTLFLLSVIGCASPPPPVVVSVPKPLAPRPVVRLSAQLRIADVGFKTPESVLYDAVADRYLVSNVDGGPLLEDHRGFISRLTPDGRVESLRFIDGDKPASVLHAPKGMAIIGDVLFIADITQIRKFDRNTGRALGTIDVSSATFLNDLCASDDGTLYASDSGLVEGYVSSASDALFSVDPRGEVRVLVRSPALAQPNGLACTDGGVLVASFGRPELRRVSRAGQLDTAQVVPKGALDGIAFAHGRLFVTSWEARAVYERVENDSEVRFVETVSDLDAPADLGVDTRRNTLLIPLFHEDAVVLWPIP